MTVEEFKMFDITGQAKFLMDFTGNLILPATDCGSCKLYEYFIEFYDDNNFAIKSESIDFYNMLEYDTVEAFLENRIRYNDDCRNVVVKHIKVCDGESYVRLQDGTKISFTLPNSLDYTIRMHSLTFDRTDIIELCLENNSYFWLDSMAIYRSIVNSIYIPNVHLSHNSIEACPFLYDVVFNQTPSKFLKYGIQTTTHMSITCVVEDYIGLIELAMTFTNSDIQPINIVRQYNKIIVSPSMFNDLIIDGDMIELKSYQTDNINKSIIVTVEDKMIQIPGSPYFTNLNTLFSGYYGDFDRLQLTGDDNYTYRIGAIYRKHPEHLYYERIYLGYQ